MRRKRAALLLRNRRSRSWRTTSTSWPKFTNRCKLCLKFQMIICNVPQLLSVNWTDAFFMLSNKCYLFCCYVYSWYVTMRIYVVSCPNLRRGYVPPWNVSSLWKQLWKRQRREPCETGRGQCKLDVVESAYTCIIVSVKYMYGVCMFSHMFYM